MFENIDRYKAQIDVLRSFEGGMLKKIKDYYRNELTYASNAMEGNSLTRSETKNILEDDLKINEKRIWDYYDAIGHAKAYDYIYDVTKDKAIGEEHIKTIHRLLYSLVDAEIGAEQAGIYRQQRIKITGSSYPLPTPDKIAPLMSCFADWLADSEDKLHPVEFAAQAHKEMVFIHPFLDGNRRVARLLMNLCLIRKGYTIAVISPALHSEYIMLLEKAHTDDKPLIEFIAASLEESQMELIRLLSQE